MNTADPPSTNTDNAVSGEERKQSPPAFLDLADSAARLGSNMSDISARVELKRLEHERQRVFQRKIFEDQMRALEQQQAQELLTLPYDPNNPGASQAGQQQPIAVSAPTTPPRVNVALNGDVPPGLRSSLSQQQSGDDSLSRPIGTTTENKRKSVTYAPSVNLSPELSGGQNFRAAGAKSMPASRRTSASEHDEDLAAHLQGLALVGERNSPSAMMPAVPATASILTRGNRFGEEAARYGAGFNAGMMLDEQLDQEMQNAMRHLPTSDDDKFQESYPHRLSTASAALDLAHRSQNSPSSSFARHESRGSSEWPQFNGRAPEGLSSRPGDRRSFTNPSLALSPSANDMVTKLASLSASSTPMMAQHPQTSHSHGQLPSSRRNSPPSILEGLGAHSVPATPIGPNGPQLMKTPGTPLTPETQGLNARINAALSSADGSANASEIQASLSRISSGPGFNSVQGALNSLQGNIDESVQQRNFMDSALYAAANGGTNGSSMENGSFGSYRGNDSSGNSTTGSTALYHHNGTRYGLGIGRGGGGGGGGGGGDGKINGLHGPKHKRGDIDREFNRFAGTRLEELQGEIPALCKDQHGCRYLQKKLEEGNPEHRDMIFRETFGHFADLMTDPFGNYLCQKMLEFSTDEQRNVLCESVAQDLVNISLNMHGTRAVQKMIDFLSTRRQADRRYNAQIHSIILALSMHVVVLIKDLNGNHVIQKCLNKLAPEDNQFIYNAVAANCVEVATHRHGCCVLQRCVDHASDQQRVQLVNEITYNALTLVQDPYGNYVVQYILDLNDNRFSDGVIRQFQGNVCALSVQKFSSNVIEKCVRVAEHSTRKMLIDELLNRSRLEKLLRDSYGNYCVQTALDYAEPAQRQMLVEGIRPVLPLIRNTPYGKRIQNKLQRDQMNHFGDYQQQQHQHPQALVNMALGNPAMASHGAGRHMSQAMHHQGNPLGDVYTAQNMYSLQASQAPYAQAHLTPQLQHMQPAIDGYVLQGNPGHNQASQSQGSSFGGSPYFGPSGMAANDPYQRAAYGFTV